MASDIILKDNKEAAHYSVEILGSSTKVRHPFGESSLSIDSRPNSCRVKIGNGAKTNTSSLSIIDKKGTTNLSSSHVTTERVRAKKISTNELSASKLTIATPIAEEFTSGKIDVMDKNGEPAVTIDGESGDILMKEIGGSLIAKLNELSSGSLSVRSNLDHSSRAQNNSELPINIYDSGTSNPEQPIISHSSRYETWGLSYRDKGDKMIFQAGGAPVLTADLGKKKVGIGTDTPSHTLHVEGEVAGRGGFKSLSDARCKQNVHDVTDGLKIINALRSVSFNWDDDILAGENIPDTLDYGFLAQEVEKVLPDLVTKDALGRRSLSYSSLIPFIVKSIQQQKTMIEKQEKVINKYSEQNRVIEERLYQLERRLNSLETSA